MGERQKQHLGRSAHDESRIRGRDFAGEDLQREEAEQVGEEKERDERTHRVVTDHELHASRAEHEEAERRMRGEAEHE